MTSPDISAEGTSDQTAHDIYAELLERTKIGLLEDDFDLFSSCFHYPHRMATFNQIWHLNGPEDQRPLFVASQKELFALGVTQFVRTVVSAEVVEPDLIVAMHESRVLNGSQLVFGPTPSLAYLVRNGDRWRVGDQSYTTQWWDRLVDLDGSGS